MPETGFYLNNQSIKELYQSVQKFAPGNQLLCKTQTNEGAGHVLIYSKSFTMLNNNEAQHITIKGRGNVRFEIPYAVHCPPNETRPESARKVLREFLEEKLSFSEYKFRVKGFLTDQVSIATGKEENTHLAVQAAKDAIINTGTCYLQETAEWLINNDAFFNSLSNKKGLNEAAKEKIIGIFIDLTTSSNKSYIDTTAEHIHKMIQDIVDYYQQHYLSLSLAPELNTFSDFINRYQRNTSTKALELIIVRNEEILHIKEKSLISSEKTAGSEKAATEIMARHAILKYLKKQSNQNVPVEKTKQTIDLLLPIKNPSLKVIEDFFLDHKKTKELLLARKLTETEITAITAIAVNLAEKEQRSGAAKKPDKIQKIIHKAIADYNNSIIEISKCTNLNDMEKYINLNKKKGNTALSIKTINKKHYFYLSSEQEKNNKNLKEKMLNRDFVRTFFRHWLPCENLQTPDNILLKRIAQTQSKMHIPALLLCDITQLVEHASLSDNIQRVKTFIIDTDNIQQIVRGKTLNKEEKDQIAELAAMAMINLKIHQSACAEIIKEIAFIGTQEYFYRQSMRHCRQFFSPGRENNYQTLNNTANLTDSGLLWVKKATFRYLSNLMQHKTVFFSIDQIKSIAQRYFDYYAEHYI